MASSNHDDTVSNGKSTLTILTLAALGVVYGDIGTSPLYAFKDAFSGPHGLPLTGANVLAVLSMMFWSVALIVSLKYVTIVLRFDNGGEGGWFPLVRGLALFVMLTTWKRAEVRVIERGHVYQAALHYGFMEQPDVPRGLKLLERHGLKFEALETTYFLGKAIPARAAKPGLFTWRRELFRWMQRNSPATAEYFKLLPDRVIELGTRVTL